MNQKEQPRLASALAQKVVDTIAPTINRNVNIMNAHGVIIASTDAARIGTRHEGSAEAISCNGIIRVSPADGSAGMQPGVNVPLTLNGQLCGVVGVTGVPHEGGAAGRPDCIDSAIALRTGLRALAQCAPRDRSPRHHFCADRRPCCPRSHRPLAGGQRLARAETHRSLAPAKFRESVA